jgi:hypothetical protein
MHDFVTFEEDVGFLRRFGDVKVFETERGGRIAVSAKYQARVMTSAIGRGARSLGFINRKFISDGATGTQFDNYGGEDRFWLGPEGGQFGLYFPPGKPFTFDAWQTPHGLQEGDWPIVEQSARGLSFSKRVDVVNYGGTKLGVKVDRKVSLLSAEDAERSLGMAIPDGVDWVGYETSNGITNAGTEPWTEKKGLPSVWILGMFAPVPGTRVIVPFEKGAAGEIVNDRYFGKVPSDRLAVREQDGYLVFKCDGAYRSKIGLGPARAKAVLGSYSDESRLLTIVWYTKPEAATRYVNSMWEVQKEPYGGDVVNSYNDGPPAPGKPALGGFYEIESSSPAAALAPGASLVHAHRTFHMTGPRASLEIIAKKVLGVTLAQASTQ